MSIDYTIFYKSRYAASEPWEEERAYDVLISAYDQSDRVRTVFSRMQAKTKHWLIHPEYALRAAEYPKDGSGIFDASIWNEADFVHELFDTIGVDVATVSLCVDITGFLRPHLLFLMRYLMDRGVRCLDVFYSEPVQYADRERTTFSSGEFRGVRPVAGYEGQHEPDEQDLNAHEKDLVVVASGYEHELIRRVAEHKRNARKVELFGFPPLQPDFYQENVLNAALASEELGAEAGGDSFFAPASDPFVTASVVRQIVSDESQRRGVRNLYLSPLSTKPQALGMGLYYMYECIGSAASVIFPIFNRYRAAASRGISKVWRYTVELPLAGGELSSEG